MDVTHLNISNAGGTEKDDSRIDELTQAAVSAVEIGSITLDGRDINEGRVFWINPDTGEAVNSIGMENEGVLWYVKNILPKVATKLRAAHKKLRVNIAGVNPGEWKELTEAVAPYADIVVFNFGCPNVIDDGGEQKAIPSFDLPMMGQCLDLGLPACEAHGAEVAVKLSPYSNPMERTSAALFLKERYRGKVHEVVLLNTFPNALAFAHDIDGRPAMDKMIYGGLSGPGMKPVALAHVHEYRNILSRNDFRIIGVTGIRSGQDIHDYLKAGASGVQVGTHYYASGREGRKRDPVVFSQMAMELSDLPDPWK